MCLNGLDRDEELLGIFLLLIAASDEPHHLTLAAISTRKLPRSSSSRSRPLRHMCRRCCASCSCPHDTSSRRGPSGGTSYEPTAESSSSRDFRSAVCRATERSSRRLNTVETAMPAPSATASPIQDEPLSHCSARVPIV